MDTYLGIDFGTSGVRCCVIDAHGELLDTVRQPLPAPQRQGRAVEQDPETWWTTLGGCLDKLGAGLMSRIRAICIDGTSSTLLICDASGQPLSPALMYNDSRARKAAAAVADVAPVESAAFGASASLAKLLWLLETPAADRAAHALHQADWLTGRLRGQFGVSDENNALKLGYDPLARRWPDWLRQLPVPTALLPHVVPAGHDLGPLSTATCQRWGFRPNTRIVSGTTDSTASFIATGAGPGDAVTALGSTLVLKVLADHPVSDPGHGVYSHRLKDHWLVGGASNSGGAVLAQFFAREAIDRYTASLQIDRPTGLDYYPLPATGERFPVNDPSLEPRLTPRPDNDAVFFQAILEGITAIEARGYALLETLGAPAPKRILTTGGGAVNEPWRRMRERVLGLPVVAAAQQEAAYGAALLALRSLD
jgi:sugar (pentulose or hexulose) kinase